jgi:hypothetical protein
MGNSSSKSKQKKSSRKERLAKESEKDLDQSESGEEEVEYEIEYVEVTESDDLQRSSKKDLSNSRPGKHGGPKAARKKQYLGEVRRADIFARQYLCSLNNLYVVYQ